VLIDNFLISSPFLIGGESFFNSFAKITVLSASSNLKIFVRDSEIYISDASGGSVLHIETNRQVSFINLEQGNFGNFGFLNSDYITKANTLIKLYI
jgi:hypothetical protein